MTYRVRLTLEAKQNIQAIGSFIAQDSLESARRWRRSVRERMRALRNYPEHEIAYHARQVGCDVRRTFYGVYRILFTIQQDAVIILSVRHGARKPPTLNEVRKLGGSGSGSQTP